MTSTLNNQASIFIDPVDKSVPVINPSAPKSRKILTQGLRLANAFKRAAHDVFYQLVDPFDRFPVFLKPINVLAPSVSGVEGRIQNHAKHTGYWLADRAGYALYFSAVAGMATLASVSVWRLAKGGKFTYSTESPRKF